MTTQTFLDDRQFADFFTNLIQDNSWAIRRVERYSHTDLPSIEISTSLDIDLKKIKKIAEDVGYEPEKYFDSSVKKTQKVQNKKFFLTSNIGYRNFRMNTSV